MYDSAQFADPEVTTGKPDNEFQQVLNYGQRRWQAGA